ncbi:MAG: DUF445 domain-containing protein [Chitinophagaceae bacterium]|nr:DUF445 domain-containing protein [Chitinophagaceae bacterium]
MNYWLIIIPLISSLLGWAGMKLGTWFLIHRAIPKRQAELAKAAGVAVGAEFSLSTIEEKIKDPSNVKKIMPLVETHIDDFLRNKLKQKMPMIGMLIGDKTINSLKEVFMKEIEELFPAVLSQFSGNLKNEIDIPKMVAGKIAAITPHQLNRALSPVSRYFEGVAALIGFLIGLVNLAIFLSIR